MTSSFQNAEAILSIDLEAVVANWRLLAAMAEPQECSAVVKADAYGLGAAPVARALQAAGCQTFFVAHLGEGLDLRKALGSAPRVFVLNGTPPGTEHEFLGASLVPVINTVGELARWRTRAAQGTRMLPIALQLDSGMSRLGLGPADIEAIRDDPDTLAGLSVDLIMSHLACADETAHSANQMQRNEFARLAAMLPRSRWSLSNSSGTFLGQDFHFDLIRPGAALYGINPQPGKANPMRPVVSLCARVLQLRDVPAGTAIGYGHAGRVDRPSRLATVSLGYADGWPRGTGASAFFRNQRLPLLGRVSMDSLVVDVTDCSINPQEGDYLDFLCPDQPVDEVGRMSGTIGYEILTGLGRRFRRAYRGAWTTA